jgi:hypothetical protein
MSRAQSGLNVTGRYKPSTLIVLNEVRPRNFTRASGAQTIGQTGTIVISARKRTMFLA